MVGLVLLFALAWAVLVVLFWAGSLWLQDLLYSEPAGQLYWRAPVAATALTAFLGFWGFLNYRAFDLSRSEPPYDALFFFGPSDHHVYPEFRAKRNGKEVVYRLKNGEYVEVQPPYRKWDPTKEVIVRDEKDGPDVVFRAELDEKGNFRRERRRVRGLGWLMGSGSEQPLKYTDDQGRVMTEVDIGRVRVFHWGLFLANLALNLAHLVLWFLCLWLVLQFQWPHALGIAFIFWGVMTVVIVHMLMTRVEDVARRRPGVAVGVPGVATGTVRLDGLAARPPYS